LKILLQVVVCLASIFFDGRIIQFQFIIVKFPDGGQSLLPINTFPRPVSRLAEIEFRQMPLSKNRVDEKPLFPVIPNFFPLEIWHFDSVSTLIEFIKRATAKFHFHNLATLFVQLIVKIALELESSRVLIGC